MKRSKFSLSHYRLMTGNMGFLYPINVTEVLPGDTVQQATSLLIRCAPMLAPVMHPVRVRIHHWYVPNRLVWDNFEDFITGGPDGNNVSAFPYISSGAGFGVGTLADHMGLPTDVAGMQVSALPFRAYALIWNEHYRDQDLQVELPVVKTDGVDTTTNVFLQNCAWEKDYFTSARPWEQKGPAITIPIGTTAPVYGVAGQPTLYSGAGIPGGISSLVTQTGSANAQWNAGSGTSYAATNLANPSNVVADLSNASAITINRLREAFALQRFEEARARYGSRYTEYLRYLGVKSSDARLQRPEYLGGGKQTIQFSEVLQTAEGEDPVGAMKGHGIGAMRSNRYRRFFEEHGYIISLMSVQPKTMYMQGIPRHWNRRVREDYWQKELEHIGQQEIANKEVYAASPSPDGVFGYQDRYDEYRRKESSVAGEFRTTVLNYWHLARDFASAPGLNATFIKCVPSERIFAAQENDQLYIMCNHSIQARRMLSSKANSFIY